MHGVFLSYIGLVFSCLTHNSGQKGTKKVLFHPIVLNLTLAFTNATARSESLGISCGA